VLFLLFSVGCPDATIQERAFHYLRQIQLAIVLEFPQLSCVHRQLLSIELPQKPLTCFSNYANDLLCFSSQFVNISVFSTLVCLPALFNLVNMHHLIQRLFSIF